MAKNQNKDLKIVTTNKRGRRKSSDESGREALLRHSLSFFARYGYEGTSLRALASKAGVDMALVGKIFGSKAALWQATVGELNLRMNMLNITLEKINQQAEKSPKTAIEDFIIHFTDFCLEFPELPSFFMNEVSNPGDRQEIVVSQILTPFRNQSRNIIKQAMSVNIVHGTDPDVVLGMLIATISLPIVAPLMFINKDISGTTLRDTIVQEATALFVNN